MATYFNRAIKTLKSWVKINSEKQPPKKNKPFGNGVDKMLKKALKDSKKLGFLCYNYSNYAGEVVWGDGKDEDGLAILCHLDVVPCGKKELWKYPPFSGKIVNGEMYGRGVIDDKGATCLCLYALKELKDEGVVPNKKVKLIFGLDEETGNDSLDFYNKITKMPKQGFSPDGDFPVSYAEKGIIHTKYTFKKGDNILLIKGGTRVNVVCDYVELTLKNISEEIRGIATKNGAITQNNLIIFKGVSAHASTPDIGDNAIKKAIKFLEEIGEFDKTDYEKFVLDSLKIKDVNDETGSLTFSPDMIENDGENLYVLTDIRYPATKNKEEIISLLDKVGKNQIVSHTKPLIVQKNSKLVQTLNKVYNEIMQTCDEPIALGGGTYAKQLENGVAFGPSLIGMDMAHVENERASLEHLEKCYKIYKQAIKELIS